MNLIARRVLHVEDIIQSINQACNQAISNVADGKIMPDDNMEGQFCLKLFIYLLIGPISTAGVFRRYPLGLLNKVTRKSIRQPISHICKLVSPRSCTCHSIDKGVPHPCLFQFMDTSNSSPCRRSDHIFQNTWMLTRF